METNIEIIIKIIGVISATYILLQLLIPIIQSLVAEGIAGIILVLIMIWWLFQKKK